MAFGSDTEKTEQPTGKRLNDARSKGSIAFSQDLNNAACLLFGFVLLYALGISTYNGICNNEIVSGKFGLQRFYS